MIATRSDTTLPAAYRPTSLPEHRTVVEQRTDGTMLMHSALPPPEPAREGLPGFSLNGGLVSLRHFVVNGKSRQDIWLDSKGIPVLFRSYESGTPIDFILEQALGPDGANPLLPAKSMIEAPSAFRNK
jgi:hypothetical protein